ncbi:hypothetical protein [Halosegnis rubeus]|uniref:hypothetical protein n=1 Tax=Halosegnis rubeus TaxID=2212850 RepID=UPI001561D79F|nr:hypothetical protein [Halosegnis rubeus]
MTDLRTTFTDFASDPAGIFVASDIDARETDVRNRDPIDITEQANLIMAGPIDEQIRYRVAASVERAGEVVGTVSDRFEPERSRTLRIVGDRYIAIRFFGEVNGPRIRIDHIEAKRGAVSRISDCHRTTVDWCVRKFDGLWGRKDRERVGETAASIPVIRSGGIDIPGLDVSFTQGVRPTGRIAMVLIDTL